MKKLLLMSMLLFASIVFAQKPFVRKYNYMVATKNFVKQNLEKADVTVVFNEQEQRKVVMYFASGEHSTYYQVSDVTEGETKRNEKYQGIQCIDEQGNSIYLQLFDNHNCLRVIVADGFKIEFYTY